jgi:hypothetical protein
MIVCSRCGGTNFRSAVSISARSSAYGVAMVVGAVMSAAFFPPILPVMIAILAYDPPFERKWRCDVCSCLVPR